MQESYRKTSNRALHQVIYFVGVRRFGEAQAARHPAVKLSLALRFRLQ
jgi:hypothetical protein